MATIAAIGGGAALKVVVRDHLPSNDDLGPTGDFCTAFAPPLEADIAAARQAIEHSHGPADPALAGLRHHQAHRWSVDSAFTAPIWLYPDAARVTRSVRRALAGDTTAPIDTPEFRTSVARLVRDAPAACHPPHP